MLTRASGLLTLVAALVVALASRRRRGLLILLLAVVALLAPLLYLYTGPIEPCRLLISRAERWPSG